MQTTLLLFALLSAPTTQDKGTAGTTVTAGIQRTYEDNRSAAGKAGQAGDLEKAADLYQQNIELGKAQNPPSQFEIAEASSDLARLRQAQRRYDDAETLFEQSIKAYEADAKPDEDVIALNVQALAMVYLAKSEFTKAESMFQRSLSLHSKLRDKTPWPEAKKFIAINVERDLFGLASAYFQAGDTQTASEYCDQAIKTGEESVSKSAVSKLEMMQVLSGCAVVKRRIGKDREAAELEKRRETLESDH